MKNRNKRLIQVPVALVLTLNFLIGTQIFAQCSQWTTTPATFCSDDAAITLVGTPAPGVFFGPGVTGSTFTPATAGAGAHNIGYAANSCTDTAFIVLTVQALPSITLLIPNNEKFVCKFDGPYTITGNNPNPGWPTSWFTGNTVDSLVGTFDPDPTNVGWNVITFNYDDGVCMGTAIDSILVQDNPTANLTPFPTLCITDPVLTLNQGTGTPAGGTFTYSGLGVSGSNPYFFDPAVAGAGTHAITYCYTATNTCQTCVTQNIVVHDVPNVAFVPPPPLCENGGPIDLSTLGIGLPLGGFYQGPGIQPDSITLKPSLMGGPGSYTLTYTFVDTTGCSSSAQQTVTVNPKPAITITSLGPATTPPAPPDQSDILIKLCQGDTALTSITSSPGFNAPWPVIEPNSPSYWTNVGGGNYQFHPPADLTFKLVIQANNGCSDTGMITIDVIPPATADLIGPASICINDTATIEVSGATTYTWLNPPSVSGSPIYVSPKADETYQVVASSDQDGDGKQCSSDTGQITVYVDPLPLVTTGRDTTIFFGDETPLRAYGAQAFVWSENYFGELSCFQCLSPIAKPLFQPGQLPYRAYYVEGTDTNGCTNVDSIIVNLNPKVIIFVPTAFSPNGDGFNDELFVETKGVRAIDFEVYDRFGKTVFESTELEKGWDGSFEGGGEVLPKDVYLYRLKATPYEETIPPIDQAGQITLMR